MIGDAVDPADVGAVYHHGPELFPVIDLVLGGGLPLAAALWLGRMRSVGTRLTGGGGRATDAGLAKGTRADHPIAARRSGPRERPL